MKHFSAFMGAVIYIVLSGGSQALYINRCCVN